MRTVSVPTTVPQCRLLPTTGDGHPKWKMDVDFMRDWSEDMTELPEDDYLVKKEDLRKVQNYRRNKINLEYFFSGGFVPSTITKMLRVDAVDDVM